MSMSSEERIKKLIDDYSEKYAAKHHISKEEARKHAMVKITTNYFKEDNKDEHVRGCLL